MILREIIGERLVVAYSEEEFAVNKSCYVLLSERATKEKLKAMLAILSSACVAFWVRMRGDKAKQALFPRITMNTLRAIPVPNGWVKKEPMLSNLVDQILAAKRADAGADTSPLEAEIDRHVYALYGLTPAEIKIVEESSR